MSGASAEHMARMRASRRPKKDPADRRATAVLASRRYAIRKKFGLTVEQYDAKRDAQRGICEICGRESDRPMPLDHDHETGALRDFLCEACNKGIGLLGDCPATLRLAAEYIERHKNTWRNYA